MTKEEIIENLLVLREWLIKGFGKEMPQEYLDTLTQAHDMLSVNLPSNLDEAAEEIASDIAPKYPDIGWDECFEKIKDGIKAGAEWMAGQGVSRECKIGVSTKEIHCLIKNDAGDTIGVAPGDKVVVQIRKAE